VIEAHAQSVMCAYNSVDAAPACANTMLLREDLRDAWKFDGYVVSDCAPVADVNTGHHSRSVPAFTASTAAWAASGA
jgi:beta-glucosidase